MAEGRLSISGHTAEKDLDDPKVFASSLGCSRAEEGIVAQNLAAIPRGNLCRGVFFDGLLRIVAQQRGPDASRGVQRAAGLPEHVVPFREYPLRDFYKLYYATTRALHPSAPFPDGLRRVSQSFFPIFRNSLFGKTMAALMGDEPRTILPLLSKAYNVSVTGTEHRSELVGERRLRWACRVEPVVWYEKTFIGIIEGTMSAEQRRSLSIDFLSSKTGPDGARYEVMIAW